MAIVKTGECYYRDEEGRLWLAESFVDGDGVVSTKERQVDQQGDVNHEITA